MVVTMMMTHIRGAGSGSGCGGARHGGRGATSASLRVAGVSAVLVVAAEVGKDLR